MAIPLDYQPAVETPPLEGTFAQKASWALYDWANSGFGLIVIGPVFQHYFLTDLLPPLASGNGLTGLTVGGVEISGSAVMGLLNSISMAAMAIAAPVLGAIADIKGWTKRLLVGHALAGSLLAMTMYFLHPGMWLAGAAPYFASNFCFGTSFAFSNAFLPKLARPEKQGSLSGWGFALGYIGGALALILALRLDNPRLGLGLAGLWWLTFSLPAFIFLREFKTPEPAGPGEGRGLALFLAGFRRIKHTFANLRQYRMLFLFLLAFLLYNDGVETVISMSPSFGTEVLGMSMNQLGTMFLIVQFVAFFGAVGFGYLADRMGNKLVITLNLLVWIASALGALFVRTPLQFTILGVLIGIVLGGVQASSRALMGLLAPAKIHNEAFGFFSISGKFASIFGPLLYAGFATALGDPRWGVLSVPPFLIAGLLLLVRVREPKANAEG